MQAYINRMHLSSIHYLLFAHWDVDVISKSHYIHMWMLVMILGYADVVHIPFICKYVIVLFYIYIYYI
jgi:hypothetical protein